jgi:hypothetical protein
VTLMKQYDVVWCVAQGEAATSGLAWTSKGGGLQRGGKKIFWRFCLWLNVDKIVQN